MRAALAALAIAAAAPALAAPPPRDAALHALFDREFRRSLQEAPEVATLLGVPDFNDRLQDPSPEAVQRRRDQARVTIRELERFDPKRLSAADRLSREVMLDTLRRLDATNAHYGPLPFGGGTDGYLPVSTMWGPHQAWSMIAKAAPFAMTRDYDNFLARLEAMPRVLEHLQARMRAGMRWGWVAPRAAMVRVPGMLAPFAAEDVTATPLWTPFRSFPGAVPAAFISMSIGTCMVP